MQFVDLEKLTIEELTEDMNLMVYCGVVEHLDDRTISSQWAITRDAVKKVLDGIDKPWRPHKFEFEVVSTEELDEYAFESAVKLILTAVFEVMHCPKGRKRERRLDVPVKLKTLNCNMSLLKNAINYQTLVDKFQIEITYKDLRYILVGGEYDN